MLKQLLNLIVGVVCGWAISYLGEEHRYRMLWLPISALALLQLLNYWILQRESPRVRTVLRMIHDALELADTDAVRVTLMKPKFNQWRQIARYSHGSPYLTNHRFHLEKGVAGQAYREKRPVYLDIAPEFHKDIITKLGFTEQEARAFIQKAEYFCIPICDSKKRVRYVLALDSDIQGVLTKERRGFLMTLIPALSDYL